MFRQDDDRPDPELPSWLVPWVYPIGIFVAGVVVLLVVLWTR